MAAPDMVVIADGAIVPDFWRYLDEESPLPDSPVIVSQARLNGDADLLATHAHGVGVRLAPDADLAALAPHLGHLRLVALVFPQFRDGRGFSLARALRERFGYQGEIRATGHVLPDQYEFLTRCGVTSVEVREGTPMAPWHDALRRFAVAYQAAANDATPLSPLRRNVAEGTI